MTNLLLSINIVVLLYVLYRTSQFASALAEFIGYMKTYGEETELIIGLMRSHMKLNSSMEELLKSGKDLIGAYHRYINAMQPEFESEKEESNDLT